MFISASPKLVCRVKGGLVSRNSEGRRRRRESVFGDPIHHLARINLSFGRGLAPRAIHSVRRLGSPNGRENVGGNGDCG